MVRECILALALMPFTGCSVILDFSEDAVPLDAGIDAPYSQRECEHLEPNDSAATAPMIAATEVIAAAICQRTPQDRDFYRFTVPAGTAQVTVKIGLASSPTGDLDLRLTDESGTMILAQSFEIGNHETIVCPAVSPACPALTPGDYVFEVFPGIAGSVNRYTIELGLTPSESFGQSNPKLGPLDAQRRDY
ncbi:MAG: PPC domain-containing protein [Kofleriaceae bacterium]